jgi:hypothetical protein
MAVQALSLDGQHWHLAGDVPAMWVLALGLAVLMPPKARRTPALG